MAITESSRHHLHQRLDEVLGPVDATTLMELLPPVGWADVATKRDLDQQDLLVDLKLDHVESSLTAKIDHVESSLTAKVDHVESSLTVKIEKMGSDLRAEMQGGFRRVLVELIAAMAALLTIAATLGHLF